MRVISTPATEVYTSFQVIKYSSTACIMATEDMSKFSQPITIPKHIDWFQFLLNAGTNIPTAKPWHTSYFFRKKIPISGNFLCQESEYFQGFWDILANIPPKKSRQFVHTLVFESLLPKTEANFKSLH